MLSNLKKKKINKLTKQTPHTQVELLDQQLELREMLWENCLVKLVVGNPLQ